MANFYGGETAFTTPQFDYASAFNQDLNLAALPDNRPWYTKLGDNFKQNPEKFAIALDMIGKGFAPDNPFAGVATSLGKSSLANKAAQEQKQNQQNWMKLVSELIAGRGNLTPAGEEGISSINITPGKDGLSDELTLKASSMRPEKEKPTFRSTSDILGF